MRWFWVVVLWAGLSAGVAEAEGEIAGDFDYYVMSLSWNPNWCAIEGDARGAPECERSLGWTLHGLWPQNQYGWPSYCRATARPPTRADTAAMADIMGSGGLAWYQWKKHGVCAGLSADAYFDLARDAYASVTRPAVLRRLEEPVRLPAALIEEAFLKANPGLEADMITITCQDGRIQEARVCLSKDLTPVPCGRDVVQDCRLKDALLAPLR